MTTSPSNWTNVPADDFPVGSICIAKTFSRGRNRGVEQKLIVGLWILTDAPSPVECEGSRRVWTKVLASDGCSAQPGCDDGDDLNPEGWYSQRFQRTTDGSLGRLQTLLLKIAHGSLPVNHYLMQFYKDADRGMMHRMARLARDVSITEATDKHKQDIATADKKYRATIDKINRKFGESDQPASDESSDETPQPVYYAL